MGQLRAARSARRDRHHGIRHVAWRRFATAARERRSAASSHSSIRTTKSIASWIETAVEVLSDPNVAATGAAYLTQPSPNWVQQQYDGLRARPVRREDVSLARQRQFRRQARGVRAGRRFRRRPDRMRRRRSLQPPAARRAIASSRIPDLRSIHFGDPDDVEGAVLRRAVARPRQPARDVRRSAHASAIFAVRWCRSRTWPASLAARARCWPAHPVIAVDVLGAAAGAGRDQGRRSSCAGSCAAALWPRRKRWPSPWCSISPAPWRCSRAAVIAHGGRLAMMQAPRPVRVLELRSVRGTGGGPEKTILLGAAMADPARAQVTVCYLRDQRDEVFAIDERAAAARASTTSKCASGIRSIRRCGGQLRKLIAERADRICPRARLQDRPARAAARAESGGVRAICRPCTAGPATRRASALSTTRPTSACSRRFPRLIAVSSDIARELVKHGADPDARHHGAQCHRPPAVRSRSGARRGDARVARHRGRITSRSARSAGSSRRSASTLLLEAFARAAQRASLRRG